MILIQITIIFNILKWYKIKWFWKVFFENFCKENLYPTIMDSINYSIEYIN